MNFSSQNSQIQRRPEGTGKFWSDFVAQQFTFQICFFFSINDNILETNLKDLSVKLFICL